MPLLGSAVCLFLMFLLAAYHRNFGLAQGAFAPLARIEPLFFAVKKLTHRKVHVANTAARAVLLASHLAVLREEVLQTGDQSFKIERTCVVATRSNDRQHTCIITGACLATIGKRTDRKSTRLNSSHSSISYAVF